MNICHIRYISGTLLIPLAVLLSACLANPPTLPQLITTPGSTENGPATKAVSKIAADNFTAIEAASLEPNIRDTQISQGPAGLITIFAVNSDNMSNYYGKEVIVEGTVVELSSLTDPSAGSSLVLYFNNANQHVTSYEAWAHGMTGTDFRVVIRENDLPKFCYQSMLLGRRLAVEGKIDVYHDAPVMFVSDPSQVTFIGTPSATAPSLSIVIACTTEIADNITYYRYQGIITNNNTEWAVHDLYLGDNKLADCIPPKGCPDCAPLYTYQQNMKKEVKLIKCLNNIKLDVKFIGDASAGVEADPLMKQISIPALRYKWKSVPVQ